MGEFVKVQIKLRWIPEMLKIPGKWYILVKENGRYQEDPSQERIDVLEVSKTDDLNHVCLVELTASSGLWIWSYRV